MPRLIAWVARVCPQFDIFDRTTIAPGADQAKHRLRNGIHHRQQHQMITPNAPRMTHILGPSAPSNRQGDAVPWVTGYALRSDVTGLGNRVWKSRTTTWSGRTAMRPILMSGGNDPTYASPRSLPR